MRSAHFRVSDEMHDLISEEAKAIGTSVARFRRDAIIARTVLWANR